MNPAVNAKIEAILQRARPEVRDELASHLATCAFDDPSDSGLNALVAQSLLLGQDASATDRSDKAVATEASLARLGDRLESTTWTVAHFKLGNLMLACVLSFGLGAGGVAFAFKMWGPTLSSLFSLPRATDARLTILSSEGAVLRVQSKEGTTYVWLEGSIEAREGQSKTGVSYLYFRP